MKRRNAKYQGSEPLSLEDADETCIRLLAAERTLGMLAHEQLPNIRKFIFNASFDLCESLQKKKIKKRIAYGGRVIPSQKDSKASGNIKLSLSKEELKILLFYDHSLTANEAILFSRSLGEIVAITYAALGLDMSGIAPINLDTNKGNK